MKQIEKAEHLAEDGEVDKAIKLLDKVLAQKLAKAVHVQALMARASIYDDAEDFHKAIADCNDALRLDPKSPDVLYLRATIYSGMENWRATKQDLDAAITIAPQPDLHELRGMARYNLGDYRGAREDFAVAIAGNEDIETRFLIYRGMAALLVDEPAEAIGDFTAALAREPDDVKALAQRAKAYEGVGNIKAALADLDRVKKLIPKSPMLDAERKRLRALKKK
jgi:tetratricopeptide (TPR) repeat protein